MEPTSGEECHAIHVHSEETLSSLPEELAIKILKFLSARDVTILGQTSRIFHQVCSDALTWSRLAFWDYGVHSRLWGHTSRSENLRRNSVVSLSHPDVPCTLAPVDYYRNVLVPYGRFLGFFHSDYPFFTARFLVVRIDYQAGGVLLGEELEAVNILPRSQMTSVFSLDPSLSIDHLEPRLVRTRAFQVDFPSSEITVDWAPSHPKVRVRCCGHALAAPAQPGRHRAVVAERGSLGRVVQESMHACQLKEKGGGFLALPEAEAGGQLWSEFDLFPFARPLHFPIPRSLPNPVTGLWPFSPQPSHQIEKSKKHADMLVVSCLSTCTTAKLNILTFDEDARFTAEYSPRFSRIKGLGEPWIDKFRPHGFDLSVPPSSVIENAPKPGVYIGTYGGHGLECLLVRYIRVQTDSVPGQWPNANVHNGWQLQAFKITGDINVPRGERSILVFLSSPVPDGVITLHETETPLPVNLNHAPELQPRWVRENASAPRVHLQVFPAQGTVAHVGFRSATEITAWVVVNGDSEEFVVVWDQLGKLSRFKFAGLE
jgi:hypothetical protein